MSFTSDNKAAFFNPAIPGVKAAYFRNSTTPIYCHFSRVTHTFSALGVSIKIGSILMEAATEDLPDIARNELIIVGTAPEAYEDQGGDEEIIEEGDGDDKTEVEEMQGEYYVLTHSSDGMGSTYVFLSRDKGA